MKQYVISGLCLLFVSTLAPTSSTKQYRTDYEYNPQTDAFYKFHSYSTSHRYAEYICAAEAAHLIHAASAMDLSQAHGMMKRFPDVGNYVWVSNDNSLLPGNKESSEEQALIDLNPRFFFPETSDEMSKTIQCDMMSRKGAIESGPCFHQRPFVCKVLAKDATYDSRCRVYSPNYNYSQPLGSCYKVSPQAFTWNEAYAECRAEAAHLLVLNSEAERQYIVDLLKTAPRIVGAKEQYFLFAGIRADRPADGAARVFRTVFNTTLEEAGYAEWSEGEPNNHLDSEYCGSIFSKNAKYNDVECTASYGFICETEVAK